MEKRKKGVDVERVGFAVALIVHVLIVLTKRKKLATVLKEVFAAAEKTVAAPGVL